MRRTALILCLALALGPAPVVAAPMPDSAAKAKAPARPVPRAAKPAGAASAQPVKAAPASVAGTAARAGADTRRGRFSADDIDAASYDGGDLPPGQSALTAKVQLLLDRAGTSPGVIDGFRGGMSESALKAFERRHALPMDGRMDPQIWELLQPFNTAPATTSYTITDADAGGLVDKIPTDYAEKAAMSAMAFTSISEKLAERFHMDEKFLIQLNPGIRFQPGATIRVMVAPKPIRTKVDRIFVDKQTGRVAAYAGERMVVDYPATVGSAATPSPHGTVTVSRVAMNPNYTYNPNINFKQGNNDRILTVPPGPNGPVGTVWIALSKPTYGIHGTPTPSRLFVSQSHGCVRLTNWDAEELAHMVVPGQTVVEFLAPGISIAQAVGMSSVAATGEGPTDATATGPGNLPASSLAGAPSAGTPGQTAASAALPGTRPRARPAGLGGGAPDAVTPAPGDAPAGTAPLPHDPALAGAVESAVDQAVDPQAPAASTPLPPAAETGAPQPGAPQATGADPLGDALDRAGAPAVTAPRHIPMGGR